MCGTPVETTPNPTSALTRELESGFSLVEVMIAVTLLAILTFGVLGTVAVGFNSDRSTRELIRCQQYAQQVLETVKSVDYIQVPSLSGSVTTEGDLSATITVSELAVGLLRVEIDVAHASQPDAAAQVVTLVADLN